MIPAFSVAPDGKPELADYPVADPRYLISRFIGSEIYLALANVEDLLQGVARAEERREESWEWSGNSFTVELSNGRCMLRSHYPECPEGWPSMVELTPEQFRTILTAWRDFVLQRESPSS
jgi:hypothetical protein